MLVKGGRVIYVSVVPEGLPQYRFNMLVCCLRENHDMNVVVLLLLDVYDVD